jgi:hypothetical protein
MLLVLQGSGHGVTCDHLKRPDRVVRLNFDGVFVLTAAVMII